MTAQLVLLGGGLAHLHLLARMRQHPLPGVKVILVTPQPQWIDAGMLAGFVAGQHALADCMTPLEPLVQQSGARWLATREVELNAQANALLLADGTVLNFDWLSVCQEPVQERDALERTLPGARKHGLFVRPLDAFAALWPRVPELAAANALRVAVIGGAGGQSTRALADAGASGGLAIELALAIRHRLPGSAVTLVTGGAPLAHGCPPALQKRLAQALRLRNVTVLADCATSLDAGEIALGSGARLACDLPVLATRPSAPAWLNNSGLAVDGQGGVAVDACGRSISHAHVFAAGPCCALPGNGNGSGSGSGNADANANGNVNDNGTGNDTADPAFASARSTHALAARFAANLAAAVAGQPMHQHPPTTDPLRLISCGDGHAIAAWGGYSTQGHWVGWLKRQVDRVKPLTTQA